jgi:prepilin-type N-terminal cleavage/methylation domain-containing protein
MERRGFTLLEVMVSVSIILLLAALLYPVAQMAKAAAKRSVATSNLRQLALAANMYRADNNGEGKYGYASDMGLPNFNTLFQQNRPILGEDELWSSPCGQHPNVAWPYSLVWTPDDNDQWAQYARNREDQVVILTDAACNPPDVSLGNPWQEKRALHVRLNGSVETQITRKDPIALSTIRDF